MRIIHSRISRPTLLTHGYNCYLLNSSYFTDTNYSIKMLNCRLSTTKQFPSKLGWEMHTKFHVTYRGGCSDMHDVFVVVQSVSVVQK